MGARKGAGNLKAASISVVTPLAGDNPTWVGTLLHSGIRMHAHSPSAAWTSALLLSGH